MRPGWRLVAGLYPFAAGAMMLNIFFLSLLLGWVGLPVMSPRTAVWLGLSLGLPPAWLGVGTLDVLHDETVEHARRLRSAGVAARLVVVPGVYHGAWGAAAGVPRVAALQADAVARLAAALELGPADGAPAR